MGKSADRQLLISTRAKVIKRQTSACFHLLQDEARFDVEHSVQLQQPAENESRAMGEISHLDSQQIVNFSCKCMTLKDFLPNSNSCRQSIASSFFQ